MANIKRATEPSDFIRKDSECRIKATPRGVREMSDGRGWLS